MDVSTRPKKTKKRQQTQVVVARPFKRPRTFAQQIGAAAGPMTPELKDITSAFTLTTGAGPVWSSIQLINPIAQGSTASQRIGRKLVLKSIFLRFAANPGTSAIGCRWLVIYDHAPNGALPVITDILSADSINAHQNLTNSDRFMVIHDDYINTPVAATSFAGKWYRKFTDQGLQSQWTTATTGTIADVVTGAIYVAYVSLAAAGTFAATARVRFTDM